MPLHLAPSDRRPPVRTDLAVHLAGRHETHAILLARTIVLTMPSARVRLAHPQPAYEAYRVWASAADHASRLFAAARPGVVPASEGHVSGHVRLDRPVRQPAVEPLHAGISPTGTAQLRVSLGGLLVVITDMEAYASQLALWTTAYQHATRRWSNLPTVQELAVGALPSFEDADTPLPARAAA